jgi:hypothetical protein
MKSFTADGYGPGCFRLRWSLSALGFRAEYPSGFIGAETNPFYFPADARESGYISQTKRMLIVIFFTAVPGLMNTVLQ